MVGGKKVPLCGSLGGCVCLPEVHAPRHTTSFLKQMPYWNAGARSQSKVLPSRSQLALSMELLINKRLAKNSRLSAFWVESSFTFLPRLVVSWVAQLLWIPRNVSSFPWPQRLGFHLCLTASMSSSPGLLVYAPCWKLLARWVSPSLPSPLWAPAASHTCVCSVASSTFPCFLGEGCILLPEYIIGKVSTQTSSVQLLLFQIICDTTTRTGNQPVLKFYQQSHPI